jgi:hypothetical protein
MPTVLITITCANPACGQTKEKRWRSSSERKPQYCSPACWFEVRRRKPFMWRKYVFTEAMDAAIRTACRKVGHLKAAWQRGVFGDIPYPIVKRQARILGCVRRQPDQCWTPEEDAILDPYVERQAALEGIREHLWTRGLSARQGTWTLHEIAEGLDIDSHVVKKWVHQGKLKAQATSNLPKARWYVSDAALRRFLVRYPYDAAHGDLRIPWLITILSGPAD